MKAAHALIVCFSLTVPFFSFRGKRMLMSKFIVNGSAAGVPVTATRACVARWRWHADANFGSVADDHSKLRNVN